MCVMIDPPLGWKYGFPKPCPEGFLEDMVMFEQWLIDNGYPEKDSMDIARGKLWYRIIGENKLSFNTPNGDRILLTNS